MPTDCKGWKELEIKQNGVYPIKPDNGPAFQVMQNNIIEQILFLLLTGLL